MRIVATRVLASELNPGDLYSTASQEYWDRVGMGASLGEGVYIRTGMPCPENQLTKEIYRITVNRHPRITRVPKANRVEID